MQRCIHYTSMAVISAGLGEEKRERERDEILGQLRTVLGSLPVLLPHVYTPRMCIFPLHCLFSHYEGVY